MATVQALWKALQELRKARVLTAVSPIGNTSVRYTALTTRSNAHVDSKGLNHQYKTMSLPTDSINVQSARCEGAQVKSCLSNSVAGTEWPFILHHAPHALHTHQNDVETHHGSSITWAMILRSQQNDNGSFKNALTLFPRLHSRLSKYLLKSKDTAVFWACKCVLVLDMAFKIVREALYDVLFWAVPIRYCYLLDSSKKTNRFLN